MKPSPVGPPSIIAAPGGGGLLTRAASDGHLQRAEILEDELATELSLSAQPDSDGLERDHLASIGIATHAAEKETTPVSFVSGIPIIGTRSRACSAASQRDRASSRASGGEASDSYAVGDDYSQEGFYDEADDENFF
jgi:hypothetical protein